MTTDAATASTQSDGGQQNGQPDDAKGLRAQLEAALAENKKLRDGQRVRAFKDAGFDPESGEGKALAKLYDGDPDVEAIRKFAADEFGWKPADTSDQPPPQQQRTEADQQRLDAQQRADQVNAASTSIEPAGRDEQIKAAEQAGDWDKVDRLNAEKLAAVRAKG